MATNNNNGAQGNSSNVSNAEKEQMKAAAKLGAKVYTGGVGGPLTDMAIDKIADSKIGQKAMEEIARNRAGRGGMPGSSNMFGNKKKKNDNNPLGGKSDDNKEENTSTSGSSESKESSSLLGIGNGSKDKIKKIKLLLSLGGGIVSALGIILVPLMIVAVILNYTAPIAKAIDAIGTLKDNSKELFEKWGNFFTGNGFNTDEEGFFKEFNKVKEKYQDPPYELTIDMPLIMATISYYYNQSNEDDSFIGEGNSEEDIDYDGMKGEIKKLAKAQINQREVTIKKTVNGIEVSETKTEYYLDTEGETNKYKTYLFDVFFEKSPINKLLKDFTGEEERKKKKEEMYQEILSLIDLYKELFENKSVLSGFICGAISPISKNGNTQYKITSPYGMRKHPTQGVMKMHGGVDLASVGGNGNDVDIIAVADGTIENIGATAGESTITINHGNFKTKYVHLYRIIDIKEGDNVTKGQIIAKMGGDPKTGADPNYSTGPHLHFEYYVNGEKDDPQKLLDNIGMDDDTCDKMLNGGNIFVKIKSAGNESGSYCPPNPEFNGEPYCSLETYILGVVAAENGGAPLESMKAQAIASRTYFLNRVYKSLKPITKDDGSIASVVEIESSQKVQVFNYNKYNTSSNKNDILSAVTSTVGKVLINNGKIFSTQYVDCSKSGYMIRVPSKKEVPANCTINKSRSHRNGMAQEGANNFAKAGKDYLFILNYYYDGEVADFDPSMVG